MSMCAEHEFYFPGGQVNKKNMYTHLMFLIGMS